MWAELRLPLHAEGDCWADIARWSMATWDMVKWFRVESGLEFFKRRVGVWVVWPSFLGGLWLIQLIQLILVLDYSWLSFCVFCFCLFLSSFYVGFLCWLPHFLSSQRSSGALLSKGGCMADETSGILRCWMLGSSGFWIFLKISINIKIIIVIIVFYFFIF